MSALLRHVLAETGSLHRFLAVLDEEDELLAASRFNELAPLAGRKQQLLAELAALDAAREAAQLGAGWPAGRAGAEAAAATDGALAPAWSQLLVLSARARERNRQLAGKVYAHMEFTAQALAFLRAREAPLYGPDGGRTAQGAGRLRLGAG